MKKVIFILILAILALNCAAEGTDWQSTKSDINWFGESAWNHILWSSLQSSYTRTMLGLTCASDGGLLFVGGLIALMSGLDAGISGTFCGVGAAYGILGLGILLAPSPEDAIRENLLSKSISEFEAIKRLAETQRNSRFIAGGVVAGLGLLGLIIPMAVLEDENKAYGALGLALVFPGAIMMLVPSPEERFLELIKQ